MNWPPMSLIRWCRREPLARTVGHVGVVLPGRYLRPGGNYLNSGQQAFVVSRS